MDQAQELSSIVGEIYEFTGKLENVSRKELHARWHLVGSIGEVHPAEKYDLKLFRAGWKAYDGEAPDERLVQIKTTQRNSVGISEESDYLIGLHIDKEGWLKEIYNGSALRDERLTGTWTVRPMAASMSRGILRTRCNSIVNFAKNSAKTLCVRTGIV